MRGKHGSDALATPEVALVRRRYRSPIDRPSVGRIEGNNAIRIIIYTDYLYYYSITFVELKRWLAP